MALPQGPIEIPNLSNLSFKAKVEDVYVDIELKVKKLVGYERRIAEIYSILAPKSDWEIKKENG